MWFWFKQLVGQIKIFLNPSFFLFLNLQNI